MSAWNAFKNDARSRLTYGQQGPFVAVSRAPNLNNTAWKSDMVAIHNLAIMWLFTGDSAYARKATNLLDSWAVTNTSWGGNESMLDIGDYAQHWATGADILRATFPGWSAANTQHVSAYFANVLWPTSFVPNPLRDNNKGAIQLKIAFGVAAFLNDQAKWDQAVETYRIDAGGGLRNSLSNGQVGDAGRDDHWFVQADALMWCAEVAWKQGVDLYSEMDNRLLAIGELYNQFNIDTAGLRFIPFGGYSAYYTNWGIRGGIRRQSAFCNIIQGAYALRKNIPTPWSTQMRALVGEGPASFLYLKSADTSTATALAAIPYPPVVPATALANIDIGNTGMAGSADYTSGVWTVRGAGNSVASAVNFTFAPVAGNASVVVKVNANSMPGAATGVMLRQSLDPAANYVSINLNNGNLTASAKGDVARTLYTHYGPRPAWWLKLERVGRRVFSLHSQDSINWSNNGQYIIPWSDTAYIGVYTVSNNTSQLNTAVFTQLEITNTSAGDAPGITSSLSASATLGTVFNYNITATGVPSSFSASGLPKGLLLDAATGLITGAPDTTGVFPVLLRANNSSGAGNAVLVIRVTGNELPAAPASVTATVVNVSDIRLSWAAVAGASAYTVKRSLTAGGSYTTIATGVTGVSFIDDNPVPEVRNYYIITANAGELEGPASVEVSGSVPPAIPVKPSITSQSGLLSLSWLPANGAASYKVKRSSKMGGPYTTIATVTNTAYDDHDVVDGGAYYYVITSVGNTLESANSPEVFSVPGAAVLTWSTAPVSDVWSDTANWQEQRTPYSPAVLTFGESLDTVLTNDVNGLEASRILFDVTANSYTVNGDTLVLINDLINNAASDQVLNVPLLLKNQVTTHVPSRSISLYGNVNGAGGIYKTGSGMLFLSGNNIYTGNTVIGGQAGNWPVTNAIGITGNGTGTPGLPVTGPLGKSKVVMKGGALYSSHGDATIYNEIDVAAGDIGYLFTTSYALHLRGRLTGSGTLRADGNTYAGLHLWADNSSFKGTFINVLRSGNNRLRFEVPESGSANATWLLDANGVDCQGLQFANGTIHFGALTGRGYFRNNAGGAPLMSIGALNTHFKFDGTINGGIAVDKVGTGTMTFSGNHTYSNATTVREGKFHLTNNSSTGTFNSAVTVVKGAFGGTGRTAKAVTIGSGVPGGVAVLEPGANGIGTLTTTGPLALLADATYSLECNFSNNTADRVVAAAVNIQQAALAVTLLTNGTLAAGSSFMIIDNTGTAAVSGTFNGLPELGVVTIGSYQFRITYRGGNGNDVVLLDDRIVPVTIISALSDTALVGRAHRYEINAIKSPAHFTATDLPAGMQLDSVTGIITGTPAEAGVFNIILTAANETTIDTATLTLVVKSNIVNGVLAAAGDRKNIIEWEPVMDYTYSVKRAETPGGPYQLLARVNGIRFVDTTVLNGAVYYYVVSGTDGDIEQGNSAEVRARPGAGQFGYWDFNEQEGTRGIDSWGANHASLAGVTGRGNGFEGQALKLDGTANSYATLPAGFISTLNDFTIGAWVKMDALGSWMRVFDFGRGTNNYQFLTVQAGATAAIRYAIKNGGAEQGITYNYAMPLNTWTHLAVTQAGKTTSLYINGTLVATNTNTTIAPAALGITNLNYLGKSQFAGDAMFRGAIDEFSIYNRALNATEINNFMKVRQILTMPALANRRVGDSTFNLLAATSSGLPLQYISTDTTVATVSNTGQVSIKSAGMTEFVAVQPGNAVYRADTIKLSLLVNGFQLQVQHMDGDNGQQTNNSIRPYLRLINADSLKLAYRELTMRYWLTAENYAGLQAFIDYAAMGSKVKAAYVPLDQPGAGAFGYVEYRFDSSAGYLDAAANSGVIQSRLANLNWANFSEADDYSYAAANVYTSNEKITVYRNGQLVYGREPVTVARFTSVKAYTLANNSGTSTINSWLKLHNEGNTPLAYEDLTVRYWFSSGDSVALNYWMDYAQLGSAQINGTFYRLNPVFSGADHYIEFGFKPTAGHFYPLSNSGNMQFRIAKANWSELLPGNDYSAPATNVFAANEHVTVYHKGQLIWGVEPYSGAANARMQAAVGVTQPVGVNIIVYPNPTPGNVFINIPDLAAGATAEVSGISGQLYRTQFLLQTTQELSLNGLPRGTYFIRIKNGKQTITKMILKQ